MEIRATILKPSNVREKVCYLRIDAFGNGTLSDAVVFRGGTGSEQLYLQAAGLEVGETVTLTGHWASREGKSDQFVVAAIQPVLYVDRAQVKSGSRLNLHTVTDAEIEQAAQEFLAQPVVNGDL